MPKLRTAPILGLVLASTTALSGLVAAQAPQISKPRPAPPGASTMPPLRPAVIDNSLAIGGDDINARKVETRMTVEVQVNGRGPYHFVVDSGADTSAVGLRIARDLQLPLGTPVILNNMTDRNIVDRVKLASLSFGPSVVSDLQVPALREEHLGGDGMIGIDALVRQRLLMDFENRIVKVEDARQPAPRFTDEIVITARLHHGQLSTVDGPFIETKEVVGGFAILEAETMQKAIEFTKRFLRVHGDEWDIECEVRQLDGPEFGRDV